MTKRGDVVIVEFPFVGGSGFKNRPAIVVQCDRLNNKLSDTIVAMVTGTIRYIGKEPSQFLVDPATPEGQSSGLYKVSAVRCESLLAIPQADILQTIGHLSAALKQKLDASLKAALDLQ